MAKINSRVELAKYCLRQLGDPVIKINVTDEQIDDAIDNALQKYYEFHADGSQLAFSIYKVTADDARLGRLAIDEKIMAVVKAINLGPANTGLNASGNLITTMYVTDMIRKSTGTTMTGGGSYTTHSSFTTGVGQFMNNMAYLNSMNQMFNAEKGLQYIKHGHFIRFNESSVLKEGNVIVLECYVANTAEEYADTYDNSWLKKYATALLKKQWANNLIKYNGFQLPSGMTIDGSTILSEANTDITQLEEELRTVWEEPILPFIG